MFLGSISSTAILLCTGYSCIYHDIMLWFSKGHIGHMIKLMMTFEVFSCQEAYLVSISTEISLFE